MHVLEHQVQAAVSSQPDRLWQRSSHSKPQLTQAQDADVHGTVVLHMSGAPRFALISPLARPRVAVKHGRQELLRERGTGALVTGRAWAAKMSWGCRCTLLS